MLGGNPVTTKTSSQTAQPLFADWMKPAPTAINISPLPLALSSNQLPAAILCWGVSNFSKEKRCNPARTPTFLSIPYSVHFIFFTPVGVSQVCLLVLYCPIHPLYIISLAFPAFLCLLSYPHPPNWFFHLQSSASPIKNYLRSTPACPAIAPIPSSVCLNQHMYKYIYFKSKFKNLNIDL